MSRLERLINLVHNKWAIRVLALLEPAHGAKFITMVNRLGVSKDSLRRTLRALIDAELVLKNPGYGHPMRPEYVLTQRGKRVSARAVPLAEALRNGSTALYKKWSLPTIAVLVPDAMSFNAIKRELGSVTPRALSLTLKDLEAAQLIVHNVDDIDPATASYCLSPAGQALAPLVLALADSL